MDVITMPQLGETVTEGTITRWARAVGDRVAPDDALFEVSTEKVDTEVPAADGGYLRAILVAEGDTVPVGAPVAVMTATADEEVDLSGLDGGAVPASPPSRSDDGDHEAADPVPAADAPTPAPAPRRDHPPLPAPSNGNGAAGGTGGGVLTPVVRRLLDEHGLAPDQVVGSGRDGRITRADVLATAAQARHSSTDVRTAPPTAPAGIPSAPAMPLRNDAPAAPSAPPVAITDDDEVVEFTRARASTAEHMVRSLATAAHALVVVEVDYAAVDAVRRSAGLSFLPFVARAAVDAIAEFPHVNASVDGERLVVHRRVHLGVAVDVDREALMVPVVRDAGDLRITALGDAVADLADRARRRRLGGHELTGGTFTITNVGAQGTLVTAPIINQPQVAILSTDGVRMAPVAVRTDDGTGDPSTRTWGMAIHPVGNLSLSFDHRAVDGAYAAAFLARVREILQTRDWQAEVAP